MLVPRLGGRLWRAVVSLNPPAGWAPSVAKLVGGGVEEQPPLSAEARLGLRAPESRSAVPPPRGRHDPSGFSRSYMGRGGAGWGNWDQEERARKLEVKQAPSARFAW